MKKTIAIVSSIMAFGAMVALLLGNAIKKNKKRGDGQSEFLQ